MQEKVPLRVTVLGVVIFCTIAWGGLILWGVPVIGQMVTWTSETMMLLAQP